MSSGHFMATDDASGRNFNDFTLGTNQVFLILTTVTGCEELNVMQTQHVISESSVCVCVRKSSRSTHISLSCHLQPHSDSTGLRTSVVAWRKNAVTDV